MHRIASIAQRCRTVLPRPSARPSVPLVRRQLPAISSGMQGRWVSSSSVIHSAQSMEEAMNRIEELFGAAKDEMEYAQESVGSVYYHEDRVTAEKAVHECLHAFDSFLEKLPSDEMRDEVRSKVGMKMKELKMEYEALPEEGN